MFNLKKFDKKLLLRKDLSGIIKIKRVSPFNKLVEYDVVELKNIFSKSGLYLKYRLQKMDTTRTNIVRNIIEENNNLRINRERENGINEELASFMTSDTM